MKLLKWLMFMLLMVAGIISIVEKDFSGSMILFGIAFLISELPK